MPSRAWREDARKYQPENMALWESGPGQIIRTEIQARSQRRLDAAQPQAAASLLHLPSSARGMEMTCIDLALALGHCDA